MHASRKGRTLKMQVSFGLPFLSNPSQVPCGNSAPIVRAKASHTGDLGANASKGKVQAYEWLGSARVIVITPTHHQTSPQTPFRSTIPPCKKTFAAAGQSSRAAHPPHDVWRRDDHGPLDEAATPTNACYVEARRIVQASSENPSRNRSIRSN